MPFNRIKRPVAGTVLVAFLSLVLQPLSVLAQDRPQPAASRRAAESGEEKFSRTLNEIHEILKELAPQAAMPHMFPRKKGETELRAIGPNMKIEVEPAKPAAGIDVAAKVSQLRAKAKELASLEEHVRAGFDETARHIKETNLPAEILARHEEALKTYETRAAEFKALLSAVERSAAGVPQQTALNDLAAFMAKYPNQKTHTPTDPNNLPWGSPKPVTREPYTSPSQFRTSRLFGEPVRIAQAGSLSGISLPSTTLPATPVPADTAPTEDVQITQAIRDLAASLNNNPVQIYNWVRNNIEFVPSYGSIQGSDMTLQTKRGNSFDTASLLIALFRAANIPARYVYGTIEVPASQVMNWVGGVTAARAAVNLIGQGGIPVIGLAQGGQVVAVRLEHVWVEAFVDYVPSRGAVNRTPETWVPMDASFKLYQSAPGIDVRANVAFDAVNFVTQIQQAAIVNDVEGSAQNFNQALIEQALTDYQLQATNYVNSQKQNAKQADVLGTQSVIQESRPILLGTLPYKTVATGAKFQVVPDNLRWKFRYEVYANDTDRAMESPFISHVQSAPGLAGKKITLSFRPATQADQDTINSFAPRPHADGTPVQPSELPRTLPGYLIRLVPQLRVENAVVATGPAFTMGTELVQNAALLNVATGLWESGADNRPTVGEHVATALDLQGISGSQIAALRGRVETVKAQLAQLQLGSTDASLLQDVSQKDLVGDLVYSSVVSYFAAIDVNGYATARSFNIATQRMPSFGNFGTVAQAQFSFGIPRNVSFPGLQMDIDRVVGSDVAKDGNAATPVLFRKAVGRMYSAHEHLVTENLFTDVNDPSRPRAVSAVRAIGIAASQGQKIYTLNQDNQSLHASIIASLAIDADVKQEIANALAVGREVTVHQASISTTGFNGAGYIIIDLETGAGAYKISSGANGAKIGLTIVGIILFFTGTAGVAPFLLVLFAIVSLLFALYSTLLTAIMIQDQGGPCSQVLADMYLGIFLALSILTAFIPRQAVERLVMTLIGIMYGGNLYKSVAGARACQ